MDSYGESYSVVEDHQQSNGHASSNPDHGWQKVTYPKRHRKQKPGAADPAGQVQGNGADKPNNVFRSLEKSSEDRHRRILEARAANAALDAPVRSKQHRSDDDDDSEDDSDGAKGNEKVEEKKVKQKKPKKPKVTVAEAAAKIDVDHLSAFLADISASYDGQQDIQLMRFADYFGRAFSGVTSAQFPWMKLFKEYSVAKQADIPLSHISEAVYKTSIDWINQRSIEALGSFVLWSVDSIIADSLQGGSKTSKKSAQQASSKSQIAIFVVLAMVLRRKPDALLAVLPTLRESSKYQGQDKLQVIVWTITQASQGDLSVGLYSWAHNLLPIISGKNPNPLSRDIILQLVEKILSTPKARSILVNGAVRKGERLVPPSALEILVRLTFPSSSSRVKATERFEAIYPVLKEVALAGAIGSKAMKQVAKDIMTFSFKAAGEGTPELSKEAAAITVWCLTQNADCYKQWDKVYQDNLEASIVVLKVLSEQWKDLSVKLAPFDPLRETLKNFRQKNEKGMASHEDAAHKPLYKEADKLCKAMLGRLSRGHACLKGTALLVVALGIGAAVMQPNMEFDWKKLSEFDWKKLSEFDWKKLSELDWKKLLLDWKEQVSVYIKSQLPK